MTHDRVQLFVQDDVTVRALSEIGIHVRRQVGDDEGRLARVVSHRHPDGGAVLEIHPSHQRKGQVRPLVRFDAAVVVRLQERVAFFLVDGSSLELDPRRIDMGANDTEPVAKVFVPYHDDRERAVAVHVIESGTGLDAGLVGEL